jgi:hypothetical protein
MRKSDVTGSIAMVKGADMIKDQNFSPLDNLRGKASGLISFLTRANLVLMRTVWSFVVWPRSIHHQSTVCRGWGCDGRLSVVKSE